MPNHIRNVCWLACLVLVTASCSSSSTEGDPAAAGAATGGRGGRGGRAGGGGAVPVVTARAMQKVVPVIIPAVGTVEALSSVQVRAQVTGQLGAIHFSEGQEVQKGARLFSLDARPFQASLQQAEAVLARDTATAQNAQGQKARAADLLQRGLIPRDQFETTTASAAALEATVAADKAALETAKLNLQYTDISAPIAGRTGALGVHVGDLIRANDANPMVVINQMSPIYVTFAVPGRYLGDIRRFQDRKPLGVTAVTPSAVAPGAPAAPPTDGPSPSKPAGATLSSGVTERGSVTFIDNSVDSTTGTIRLKGTFDNRDRQLWPGTFVQVSLHLTSDAGAIVVPAAAVQASQDGQFVYVIKADRTAELRPVRVERQAGDEIVIADGVSAGEEVVTDGHLRLTPGARVTGRGEGGSRGEGRRGEGGGADAGRGDNGRGDGGRGERAGGREGPRKQGQGSGQGQ
jgi:multidrug efflux system membrane fusion protein